ncbi:MAG: fumarylacetoacetate hydrolase family protein [Actinomycetota bacterium]|nr:fumarylacetoacetate hydrolase family protein [Actinomycetota bacterium]
MKLLRFGAPGSERPGVLDSSGAIRDLSGLTHDIDGAFLASDFCSRVENALDVGRLPIVTDPVRIGPPVTRPGKIIGIGLNYRDHAAELGVAAPVEPIVFLKASSSMVGPYDDIEMPAGSTQTDWEVEMGVVVGSRLRHCTDPMQALRSIAGYVAANDVSERDLQLNHGPTWDKGKSCDTFCPVGPWLVTPDEIEDPAELGLELSVNGESRQSSCTDQMIFGVGYLLVFLSRHMTLEPGDLILTGTPGGVAMGRPEPKPYLREGDLVELQISGLGRHRSLVRSSFGPNA